MGLRLYVGSVACDTPREVAEKYAYGLCAYDISENYTKGRGLVIRQQCVNPGYMWLNGNMLYTGCEFIDYAYFCAYKLDPVDGSAELVDTMKVEGSGLCQINGYGNVLLGAEFWVGNLLSCLLDENGHFVKSHLIHHEGSSIRLPRQACAHVHSVYPSPDGRFAIACDLGMDKLMIYRIQADGSLTPNEAQPFVEAPKGTGPRHFVFHPNGKFGYVVTEMTDDVVVYSYDAENGVFSYITMLSGLPEDCKDQSMAAEIRISADGRFLYTSHRMVNFISVYKIDDTTGIPTRYATCPCYGNGPRSFTFSPDGKAVAIVNRDENLVVICAVDPETGLIGEKLWEDVVMEPCCAVWQEY